MLFYRETIDGDRVDCTDALRGHRAGSCCVLIGGGYSLRDLSQSEAQWLSEAPVAKFGMNYSCRGPDGTGWIVKPNMWTAYDPTNRWSPIVYSDPSIQKFLPESRRDDTYGDMYRKVKDSPNTFLFAKEYRKYSEFLKKSGKILDASDSFLQALDIAYQLGFRQIFCLGTPFKVKPSQEQIEYGLRHGVDFNKLLYNNYRTDRLHHFVEAIKKSSGKHDNQILSELGELDREAQYSCSETKPFATAASTDKHYWDRVQYLRMARRNLEENGVSLISLDKESRLHDFFTHVSFSSFKSSIDSRLGNYSSEKTLGKITTVSAGTKLFMQDCKYHGSAQAKQPRVRVVACDKEKAKSISPPAITNKAIQDFVKDFKG